MFFHNLKYEIVTSLRARDLIFWLMIFPIIMGVFFKIALGGIYEKDIKFNTVPVAIVENEKSENFRDVVKSVEEADEPLFAVTWTDSEKAMELLKNEEVKGVIFVEKEGEDSAENSIASALGYSTAKTKLTLTVSSNNIESTILKKFIENYMAKESAVMDAYMNDPAGAPKVVETLSQELTVSEDMPLTDGNTDPFVVYMYNLIAMVALFGSVTGLHIAIQNQANLSPLGARRCCTPTPKSIAMVASLVGSFFVQGLCVILCITFELLVLGVDFGPRTPLVYVAGVLGGIVGVSLGFFVGSIGRLSLNVKVGISMAITMPLCFLSGLMFGDMVEIIEKNAPIVNDLNPAAIIKDSIYYLTVDADLTRFWGKILSMLGFVVVFIALGVALTRRKKYASL